MADITSVQPRSEKLGRGMISRQPTLSDGEGKIPVLDEDIVDQSFAGAPFVQSTCEDFVNKVRSLRRDCMRDEEASQMRRCKELEDELQEAELKLVGKKLEEQDYKVRKAERELQKKAMDLKIERHQYLRHELQKAKRVKRKELTHELQKVADELRKAEIDLKSTHYLEQTEGIPEREKVIRLYNLIDETKVKLAGIRTELNDMPRYDRDEAVANIRCALTCKNLTRKSFLCLITARRSVFLSFRFVLHFRDREERCSTTLV